MQLRINYIVPMSKPWAAVKRMDNRDVNIYKVEQPRLMGR
jgi:hypothetical protein